MTPPGDAAQPDRRPPTPEPGVVTVTPSDLDEATEHLWKTYEAVGEWTRFADVKAGALLAAHGALLALALGAAKDIKPFLTADAWSTGLTVVGVVGLIGSTGYALWCVIPRRRVPGAPPGKGSLLYFDEIANQGRDAYVEAARALGRDDRAFREIGGQVWAISKVAAEKYRKVEFATWSLGVALACAVLVGVAAVGRP